MVLAEESSFFRESRPSIYLMISCFGPRMSGVNINQWRGSIGQFNILRNSQKSPITHKTFLISTEFMKYLSFFHGHILFVLSLIQGFSVIFGFSCMAIFLFPSIFLVQMVLGNLLCPHSISTCRNISLSCYLVFSFPKFILLLIKKLLSKLNSMAHNFAFLLLVSSMLLIMAGIESNPGPQSKKILSFAVWNLDSLPARDFARIPLIEAFQAEYKFDMFGVVESALTANVPKDSILAEGFSPDPLRADNADETRNGLLVLPRRPTHKI